eukprot:GFUD01032266.1.p1 GENE.GFUD01032266.1~~GFUD01032266.1.p1  ORF type:complete len:659 (-),score=121.63 GFUD01032266.1:313-2289(-)
MAGTEKENNLSESDVKDEQTNTVEEETSSIRENGNAESEYIEADDMHSSKEWEKQGLLKQSNRMLSLQDEVMELDDKVKVVVIHDAIQSDNEDMSENAKSHVDTKKFFSREWKAFKDEMGTKLSDKKEISTVINFGEMGKEWKSEGNDKHWSNQAVKKDGETCSTLFSTIITGILFTLIPNCAIVLDYMTAKEYIFGNYYIKYETDPHSFDCRNTSSGQTECLEYDPIYGGLTLSLTFISGFFWSFGIFLQLGTYLRKVQPEVFQRKRMLFLFFLPLALISMISFPLQLFVVSLISCFNDQDQWILLTTKIGIAEGMFNAHFQYMLQLFIIFTRADRHPSLFQYLSAFGSLIFLAYSRIESLLLDRGGHHMSPGQKAWWICRFGPCFLFNCAFKVGSISLIIAMLRFNSIWFYGTIIITWFLLQILFNEQCLPSKYYYLFIGAGLHAISVAHIPQEVKLIDTKPDSKNNILWTTRLSSRQLRFNLLFQNFVWFIINSIIIITLTIVNYLEPETEISTFWPFISKTYSFKENKVFRVLYIIAPILLLVGLISQVLLWRFEFKKKDKQKVRQAILMHKKDATDGLRQLSAESDCDPSMAADIVFDGWRHVPENCPGCENGTCWHRHVSDDVLEAGVQGRLSQVIYPLMNIWQNVVDKNTA